MATMIVLPICKCSAWLQKTHRRWPKKVFKEKIQNLYIILIIMILYTDKEKFVILCPWLYSMLWAGRVYCDSFPGRAIGHFLRKTLWFAFLVARVLLVLRPSIDSGCEDRKWILQRGWRRTRGPFSSFTSKFQSSLSGICSGKQWACIQGIMIRICHLNAMGLPFSLDLEIVTVKTNHFWPVLLAPRGWFTPLFPNCKAFALQYFVWAIVCKQLMLAVCGVLVYHVYGYHWCNHTKRTC